MLSVWHDQDYDLDFSTDEAQRIVGQVGVFNDELVESGSFVFACGLMPRNEASVARSGEDGVFLTDGPYAESKEHIGGFWIIEAVNHDAAAEWARRAAAACEGPVELRPVHGG
jgi:hypothetical protein